MGIVETTLANFELEEIDTCQVEVNATGVVHLHLDHLRIEMSPAEFEYFATVVERARIQLQEMKSSDAP